MPRSYLVNLDPGCSLEIWPNSNAGTIIFYPGSMMGPGHYYIFLSALRRAGFSIAGIHLPGHGRQLAGLGRFRIFTFQDLLNQGIRAEEWLVQNGLGPVAVCGHSQGGILAIAHAAQSSSLSAAFAITAVLPQMEEAIELTRFRPLRHHRDAVLKWLSTIDRIFPWLPVPLPAYLQMSRIIAGRKKPVSTGRERSRFAYPLSYLVSLFSLALPTRLRCPCWLISAKNDALFTQRLMLGLQNMLGLDNSRMIWLPDGGHLAPLNPVLAEFVARTAASFCAGLGFPVVLEAGGV